MTPATTPAEIDQKAFRRALGNFATGVTIVTASAPDGTKVGVTANSFNSLSMNPPLILWSSRKDALSCAVFERASHFAVNILASDQMAMSNHFARQQADKFDGVAWQTGIGGAPVFPNCAGRFCCESYDTLDGGDHWIFVGRVVAFDDFGRAPLCFHQGAYAMIFTHPGSFPKSGERGRCDTEGGRMGNHAFFQMLRATRAYQDRYQPKLETLGLNVIEARILLVLTDLAPLDLDGLVMHLHAPITEARVALASLADQGLVGSDGHGYTLTQSGRAKAEACWNVAEAHARDTFAEMSDAQVDAFTDVLRQIIEH